MLKLWNVRNAALALGIIFSCSSSHVARKEDSQIETKTQREVNPDGTAGLAFRVEPVRIRCCRQA